MNYNANAEINLLWTGGWDSTFRLLYLVFVEKKSVQPFYIIDTQRPSTLNELRAMHIIRKEITKKNPQLADLIKPTIIVSVHDIKPDPDITAKFNRLKEKLSTPLGSQYEWLARFAKQWNIPNLELCIELSKRAPNALVNLLSPYVGNDLRMKQLDENDDASIFSFFSFPLLKLSKNDMKKIAVEKGFLDILEKTWFCHTPWHNKPCGICVPCDIAIKEGLGYRVPKISRLRHKIWKVVGYLRKQTRIFKSFKRPYRSSFLAKVKLKDGEHVYIRFLQLHDLLYLDRMYALLSEQTKFFFHPTYFKGNLFSRIIEKFKFTLFCFPIFRRLLLKIFPRAIVIPIVAVNKTGEIISLSYFKILNWLPRSRYFAIHSLVVTDKYQNKGLGSQMIALSNSVARSHNIAEIYAHVLATNKRVLHLSSKLGYNVASRHKY